MGRQEYMYTINVSAQHLMLFNWENLKNTVITSCEVFRMRHPAVTLLHFLMVLLPMKYPSGARNRCQWSICSVGHFMRQEQYKRHKILRLNMGNMRY